MILILLFQVGNRSSEFHPEVRRVRREGSYIYEEFMPTGGTDVKVVSLLIICLVLIPLMDGLTALYPFS